jgi:branched-chain amino acid transport system ATP-binding protein
MALLEIENLSVAYGSVRAVRGISIEIAEGEIVALLGPNGAGKTTTLSAVMGLVPIAGGRVCFAGSDITNRTPERTVRSGMTLVPEGRRVFSNLTVSENLRLGAVGALDRPATPEKDVFELFPILAERRGQLAGTLSGGEQQQLAIARALRSSPRLLLLDEPSLGLAPQVVEAIFDLIVKLRERGTTIFLVEQNVNLALEIASRAYVLRSGALHLSGSSEDLLGSNAVDRAYLGIGAS